MSTTPPIDRVRDDELLKQASAGDAQAFAELFRRRHLDVFRFAMHMTGLPAIAEDTVQEVFITVLRFVSLPTAVGLPGLESGRIVRVELATSLLPAYGIDVVPDSEWGVVEADVLVGQDGQPGAIRFVNLKTGIRRTP
jgi:hypothetical protein